MKNILILVNLLRLSKHIGLEEEKINIKEIIKILSKEPIIKKYLS